MGTPTGASKKTLPSGSTGTVPRTARALLCVAAPIRGKEGEVVVNIKLAEDQAGDPGKGIVVIGGEEIKGLAEVDDPFRLHTVVLTGQDRAVGSCIADLGLDGLNVAVVTVRRAGICGDAPDPRMVLQPGDALILQGDAEHLAAAELRFRKGSAAPA